MDVGNALHIAQIEALHIAWGKLWESITYYKDKRQSRFKLIMRREYEQLIDTHDA